MDRCPKDEPAGKNLVYKKSSSYFREKLEKPVGEVASTPPLGHRRVKSVVVTFGGRDLFNLAINRQNSVHW